MTNMKSMCSITQIKFVNGIKKFSGVECQYWNGSNGFFGFKEHNQTTICNYLGNKPIFI